MTRASPYFLHSASPERGYMVERGAPPRDTAASPAPLILQSKGFDGLTDLIRGRALRAADASKFGGSPKFGLSAETRVVGDEERRTQSLPLFPLPTVSLTKVTVSVVVGFVPEVLMVPSRLIRYGQTISRPLPDVRPDPVDNQSAVKKTTFLELPPKRGLKLITHVKEGEFGLDSKEVHRIMNGIEFLPVAEGPPPRDEASIALVRKGWRINQLGPEKAATFGVGSVPMQPDGAYAVGRTTSYWRTSGFSSTIPVIGARTVFSGVTTQVALFAPSEECPQGRAAVTEVWFRQYAPRSGYKVKLKERETGGMSKKP